MSLGRAIGNEFMATVGQSEAETGTATDRRAWTAERVKQAIAALGIGGNVCCEVGKYTGDGSVSQQVDLVDETMEVKYVWIWENVTGDGDGVNPVFTTSDYVDEHANGMAISVQDAKAYQNKIIALGTGSVTVDDNGADEFPNENGQVYQYFAAGSC